MKKAFRKEKKLNLLKETIVILDSLKLNHIIGGNVKQQSKQIVANNPTGPGENTMETVVNGQ
ncbi:MAG TPA: hypothetical protein VFF27_16115 [Bacteroidia bacterium]|jgi:hypothetical protein|nr:hypothetical protein [Bacteroidia bacterium]